MKVCSDADVTAMVSLRLLCARHNVWLILAVVELCCGTQFLIFLPAGEILQLRQVAGKLVAIQSAFDLKNKRKKKKMVT